MRIHVKDSGIGIRPEQLAKIFEPFQRGDASARYEGTGIGLAIVKKALDRMGGKVGVSSRIGDGSDFWMELPAAVT